MPGVRDKTKYMYYNELAIVNSKDIHTYTLADYCMWLNRADMNHIISL